MLQLSDEGAMCSLNYTISNILVELKQWYTSFLLIKFIYAFTVKNIPRKVLLEATEGSS